VPTLHPKACKRASASPARVTAFQDGFSIAHAQKNKINLCYEVDAPTALVPGDLVLDVFESGLSKKRNHSIKYGYHQMLPA
jgi:hypothetical protein